jgi:hypothetical protein
MTRLEEFSQQLGLLQGDTDYGADIEYDDQPHRLRHGSHRVVRNQNDFSSKIKLTIPEFNDTYNSDAYLDLELAVVQKIRCHAFCANHQVRAATSEVTDFAFIWWSEHCNTHPTKIPTTWDALKVLMCHRFVPSYYARDLLNKLQCLKQGTHSIEESYQELQIGMLRCGLVENNDAAMARFLGVLNHEIQDVLDYKEYNNINCLFHLACKAEREVQGRHTRTQANSSAGRTTSFNSKPTTMVPPAATSPSTSTPHDKALEKSLVPPPATKGASFAGRTKDIQCHHCKGFGHVIRDCHNKCTLIIRDNGEYSLASDSKETIYVTPQVLPKALAQGAHLWPLIQCEK